MTNVDKRDLISKTIDTTINKSLKLPSDRPNDSLVIQIINDRPDSILIKEDAKGNLHAELKVYGDFVGDAQGFLDRTKEVWRKVNVDLLKREIPVGVR